MRIGLSSAVKIFFVLSIILAGYGLCQTVVNYVFVSEATAQTKAAVVSLTFDNSTATYVNVTFKVSNPSHLRISVYLIEYSLYIYNSSSRSSNPFEYVGGGGYSGYEGQSEFHVNGGTARYLETSVKITSQAYLQNVEYISKRQHPIEHQFNLAGRVCYKIYPSQVSNVLIIGYSPGGGGSYAGTR